MIIPLGLEAQMRPEAARRRGVDQERLRGEGDI